METERKRIGVDMDDTLFDFVGAFVNYSNKTCGTNIKKEDFISYSFHEVLKEATERESTRKVFEFYDTDFFRKMPLLPNSINAINLLKKKYGLYVITYRPDYLYNDTMNQIWANFRGCFSDVFFAFNPYTAGEHTRKSKAEICLDNKISKMIDDSLDCIMDCKKKGVPGLLFGNYPWNQNGEHKGIIRVKNWKKVLEKLEGER